MQARRRREEKKEKGERERKKEGKEEKGIVRSCSNPKFELEIGKEVVCIDPHYYRPTEVDLLVGDASKAKKKLQWVPEYTLKEMIAEMMTSDLKLMEKELFLQKGGHDILNNYE